MTKYKFPNDAKRGEFGRDIFTQKHHQKASISVSIIILKMINTITSRINTLLSVL